MQASVKEKAKRRERGEKEEERERERERERREESGQSDILNLLLPSCVVHVLMILSPIFSSDEMSTDE